MLLVVILSVFNVTLYCIQKLFNRRESKILNVNNYILDTTFEVLLKKKSHLCKYNSKQKLLKTHKSKSHSIIHRPLEPLEKIQSA